jgi:NTP pyrophosphatase (non-canonical NTP hydrolase)
MYIQREKIMSLDLLARETHITAKAKGFWDGEINYDKIGNKLALVHSEVTEVLEAIRKSKGGDEVVEEMADVIIRLVDIYQAMVNSGDITRSLDIAIETKMMKNKARPALHGNLF